MHAAVHKNNTVKKGMRVMKNCVQQLLNASDIDIMECDVQSAAAMTRLRRWALEDGLHGRATHPSGRGIIVDPDEPEWLPGKITEQAKTRRGEGASFGVLFRDGNHHPGVPFAHIRRLVSGQRT